MSKLKVGDVVQILDDNLGAMDKWLYAIGVVVETGRIAQVDLGERPFFTSEGTVNLPAGFLSTELEKIGTLD